MKLSFKTLGNGPRVLLAFHGVSQTGAACFEVFARHLGDIFTIYAFDLPFHGQSAAYFSDPRWEKGDQPISIAEFREFLEAFLKDRQIDRFSVAGFSLGGRFALAVMQLLSVQIDEAYLIAPDGVQPHVIYRIATGGRWMRRLFRWVMHHPGVLERPAVMLQKAGLLHPSVLKMYRHLTATDERALTVYYSWVNFRKLKWGIDEKSVKMSGLISNTYIFVAQFDYLVKEKDLAPLTEYIPAHHVIPMSCGHMGAVEFAVPIIKKMIN